MPGTTRDRRKVLIGGLQKRHRNLRKSFEGTYGEEALPLVGLDAPPSKRYVAVREQSVEVLERMSDPELTSRLPEPNSGQPPIDPSQIAAAMEAEIRELEEVLEAIRRMRKQVDESLVAKRAALKEHRRVYLNVARLQEAYYRLAGLDELADRIRSPKLPRRSSAADKAEAAPEGSGASDATTEEEAPEASSPEETTA